VVFLEDDLVVAPDFYASIAAASRFKRAANAPVFAMGGWAGISTVEPRPQSFLHKTWVAFPTMGYGFNRTLWEELRPVSSQIAESTGVGDKKHTTLEDWSFAASSSLRQRFNATRSAVLRGFRVPAEVRLIQPTVSRVWHIGHNSSIAQDESQKQGWCVPQKPLRKPPLVSFLSSRRSLMS